MKTLVALALFVGLFPPTVFDHNLQTDAQEEVARKYAGALRRVADYRDKIRDLHPAFERLHPIALFEGGRLFVFSPEPSGDYALAKVSPTRMSLPKGIRASFPLDFYGNRPACVVTGEVFENRAGYATIFHEFVHCDQFDTVEPELKEGLQVYREAMAGNDYSWEISHRFPYSDPRFEARFKALVEALGAGDDRAVSRCRRELRGGLGTKDFEYMAWEEWKEGLARFLENKVRTRLGLEPIQGILGKPFDRVSFYVSGELIIRHLDHRNPGLASDTRRLYRAMVSLGEDGN